MDEVENSANVQSNKPEDLGDPNALFERTKCLFQAKDDTSKFVGFALLKTIIDNGQLAKDPEKLRILWEYIPPKFLDRLLCAQSNENTSQQEAKNMADLAISVLHLFVNLLPETSLKEKRLLARMTSLLKALIRSSAESSKLILQTLMTIISHHEGSVKLLSIQDLSPLIEIATQEPLVLNLFFCAWVNLSATATGVEIVRQTIDKVIQSLVISFRGTDAVTLLNFIADLLPKLEPAALPLKPKWLNSIIEMIRNLATSRPTATGRAAYTKLAASLLLAWPDSCTTLLFEDCVENKLNSKPFSYLFINLILIDLRSSFPNLLSQLNSTNYLETSQRLCAAFDIVSSFIGLLIRSLDMPDPYKLSLTPDLLLKLRKDIAETMSLTIEYMRDRWDASVAGAAGLNPSARGVIPGARLGLTWESKKDTVRSDPLVFAGIRALAIWIREDENEKLRSESAGLMDMWIDLYKMSGSQSGSFDFRYSIALAMESMVTTYDGVENFLHQDGWQTFSSDLDNIIHSTSDSHKIIETHFLSTEANRGIQIIRVLLAIIDHPSTGSIEEFWMSIVQSTSGIKIKKEPVISILTEFHIATLQLSMALLTKAAGGMTKRYVTSQSPLSGIINQLKDQLNSMNNRIEAAELMELLEDVSLELENLHQNRNDE